MRILSMVLSAMLVGAPAAFQYRPEKPKAGESTTFDAAPMGADHGRIVSYEWSFGDDTRAWTTGPTWKHTYDEPGGYAVTLAAAQQTGPQSRALEEIAEMTRIWRKRLTTNPHAPGRPDP
jgi:PKD repeat protein